MASVVVDVFQTVDLTKLSITLSQYHYTPMSEDDLVQIDSYPPSHPLKGKNITPNTREEYHTGGGGSYQGYDSFRSQELTDITIDIFHIKDHIAKDSFIA